MANSSDSDPIIYKAMIIIDTGINKMDVIKHDGRHWLVPNWFVNRAEGMQMPERIVLLDTIPHTESPTVHDWQFVVSFPVPKELFESDDPSTAGPQYVVHLRPDIRIPLPGKLN